MPEYPLFKSYPKGSHRMDIVIGPEVTICLFNCNGSGSDSWADGATVSRLKKTITSKAAKMRLAKFFAAWAIHTESDDPEQNGYYSCPFSDKDKLTDSDINTGLKMLCERFGCDVIQLVGKNQFGFACIYPELATGQAVKEFWTND